MASWMILQVCLFFVDSNSLLEHHTLEQWKNWSLGGKTAETIDRCFKFNSIPLIVNALEKEVRVSLAIYATEHRMGQETDFDPQKFVSHESFGTMFQRLISRSRLNNCDAVQMLILRRVSGWNMHLLNLFWYILLS